MGGVAGSAGVQVPAPNASDALQGNDAQRPTADTRLLMLIAADVASARTHAFDYRPDQRARGDRQPLLQKDPSRAQMLNHRRPSRPRLPPAAPGRPTARGGGTQLRYVAHRRTGTPCMAGDRCLRQPLGQQ
jgi:hypothetical protein